MKVKYATETFATSGPMGAIRVTAGEVWDADDPIVRRHPNAFRARPLDVHVRRSTPPVEQATAAPGEKRG